MRNILCVWYIPDKDGINAARIEYLIREADSLPFLFDDVALIVPSHLDYPDLATDPLLLRLHYALGSQRRTNWKMGLIWGRWLMQSWGNIDAEAYLDVHHYRTALRVVREEAERLGAESLIEVEAHGAESPYKDRDWRYGLRGNAQQVDEIMRSIDDCERVDWVMGVGSMQVDHASWTLRQLGFADMTYKMYGAHTGDMSGVKAKLAKIHPPPYTPMPLTCWGSAVTRDGKENEGSIGTTAWARMHWRRLQEYMQIRGIGPMTSNFLYVADPDVATDGYQATIAELLNTARGVRKGIRIPL